MTPVSHGQPQGQHAPGQVPRGFMEYEFAAGLLHELSSPLTSVNGYVELLLDGEVGAIGAEQRDVLLVVKSNLDRLAGLINHVTQLARVQAGKIPQHPGPIYLQMALEQSQLLESTPGTDGKGGDRQRIQLSLPSDLPPVLVDAAHLPAIIAPLLEHARRGGGNGDGIVVTGHSDGQTVTLEVRDGGPALTELECAALGQPFARSRRLRSRPYSTLGIELAVAMALVQRLGGSLTVESPTLSGGAGCAIRITLPLAGG